MPANHLITGPPRSGKTTVVQRTVRRLEADGYEAGGVYCPEVRSEGERVGFDIVDVMSGESRALARVDRAEGPRVGSYRVDVEGVDAVSTRAFCRALDEAAFVVVDEIAPMEVHSDEFVRQVRAALDSELPLVGAVHYRVTDGVIGEVKARTDTCSFDVTEDTRDALPSELATRVRDHL